MSTWRFALASAAVVALSVGVLGGLATAESTEEGVIKYRQSLMGSQAGHIGAIVRIVRGQVDFTDDLLPHAQALSATSGMILQAFPEGSNLAAESAALPDIWTDWDGFVAAQQGLAEATAALVAAAETGDMAVIGPAVRAVGEACGDCHEPYRAEQ